MNLIRKISQKAIKLFIEPTSFFSIKTSQATIYQKLDQKENQVYSREYFKLRNEIPNYEQSLKIIENEKKKQEKQKQFFQNKFNDKNQQNFIKVSLNHEIFTNNSLNKSEQQKQIEKTSVQPFSLRLKPRSQKILVSGLRKNIPTSMKRLYYPLRLIKRQHVYEAISISTVQKTKASKYVIQILKQVMNHAINKDMDPDRLYVHSTNMGLQRRFKRLRFHAKGRHGIMQTKISQVRITLEEKPIKEMYKEMLIGKTPPALAYKMRQSLLNNNADYDMIRRNSFVLTARGRQQKRMIFRRKVQLQYMQFKKQGVVVPKKIIAQKLLEEEASQWATSYEQKRNDVNVASINKRTAIFKKNEEITG